MSLIKLVKKDFQSGKVYTIFSLVILFILSVLLMASTMDLNTANSAGESATIEMMIYLIMITLVSRVGSLLYMKLDELYNVSYVITSLPVTRKEIVMAKYVSASLHVGLSLLIQLLAVVIVILISGLWSAPGLSFAYSPTFWFALLLILIAYNSLSFPVYFKYGLSRGVMAVLLIQFALALIIITVVYNLDDLSILFNQFENLLEWLKDQSLAGVLLVAILIVSLITTLSIKLSVNTYKVQDL